MNSFLTIMNRAMVTREQEIVLQNMMNASIGAVLVIEQEVRFNLSRLLLRWYRLVMRGENVDSPWAIALREKLDDLLREWESIQDFIKKQL